VRVRGREWEVLCGIIVRRNGIASAMERIGNVVRYSSKEEWD
jgi:hypothetical protein